VTLYASEPALSVLRSSGVAGVLGQHL